MTFVCRKEQSFKVLRRLKVIFKESLNLWKSQTTVNLQRHNISKSCLVLGSLTCSNPKRCVTTILTTSVICIFCSWPTILLSRHFSLWTASVPLCASVMSRFSLRTASGHRAVLHRRGQQPLLHLQRRTQWVGGQQPQLWGNTQIQVPAC